MPHNKTRLWVGLAIVAITIPAVGTFYSHAAATNDLVGNPISAAGRIDLASRQEDSFGSGRIALREPLRNYQAEVSAALARQGIYPGGPYQGDTTDDEVFDTDPLDADTDAYGNVSTRDVPNASSLLTPGNPNVIAYSTDGPITTDASSASVPSSMTASNAQYAANGQYMGNGQTVDDGGTTNAMANSQATSANADGGYPLDDYGQEGTMSDSDVYRLVTNNLSADHRDDFVRAYAAMSEEQRAGLLDSFRQQIQGGQ